MRVMIGLLAVVGCSYSPGSYQYPGRTFPGQRLTVGCLDISVDRRPDMNGAVVLDYQFGNRCDESVVVDLARVPVIARTRAGDELALEPYDPRLQIRALRLGARQAGSEAIAYPNTQRLAQVCVDAAALAAGTSEQRWICFAAQDDLQDRTIAEVTP